MAKIPDMVVRVEYREEGLRSPFRRGVVLGNFVGAAILFLILQFRTHLIDQDLLYGAGYLLACGLAWREVGE